MIRRLSPVAAQVLKVLPRKRLSWCLGQLAEVGAPPQLLDVLVEQFIETFHVDMREVADEGPFHSFDAFFTRRLREGARPVDPTPGAIVSPADGRLEAFGEVSGSLKLQIKGHEYGIEALLNGISDPTPYRGGQFAVIYLSPRDYHRVHAPVSGRIIEVVHIPGTLFPVNTIGVSHIKGLFARNERVAFVHDCEPGPVCSLMVGAIGVGRITTPFAQLETNRGPRLAEPMVHDCSERVRKGDELGVFHLGSTVILILSRSRASSLHWCQPMGAQLRVGEALSIPTSQNATEGAPSA